MPGLWKPKLVVVVGMIFQHDFTRARSVLNKNPKGQLFKRSLASVWQKRVLSHFQFAERFYKNTIYREQFMKSYGVDKKSICLLKIIHYGRDLEVHRFPKPRSKSDPKFLENESRVLQSHHPDKAFWINLGFWETAHPSLSQHFAQSEK